MVIKTLKEPFNNRKGLGAFDMVYHFTMIILVVYFLIYTTLSLSYDFVRSQYNRVAQAELDAISENRALTNDIQTHYAKDLDALKWFTGDYEVRYRTLDFTDGGFNNTKLGVSSNGTSIGEFEFQQGQIVRIEIVSSYDTQLAKFASMLGTVEDMRVVGVSEGGVK